MNLDAEKKLTQTADTAQCLNRRSEFPELFSGGFEAQLPQKFLDSIPTTLGHNAESSFDSFWVKGVYAVPHREMKTIYAI